MSNQVIRSVRKRTHNKKRSFTIKFLFFYISESLFLFKKGSEKGSDSVDLYCNVVKFRISKIALNQGFSHLLTCSESLFHLCNYQVLQSIFLLIFYQIILLASLSLHIQFRPYKGCKLHHLVPLVFVQNILLIVLRNE